MEVAGGVHRCSGGIVNFYLIEDGGKVTAIDAGTPRDWNLLVRTLSQLRLALGDLEAILLTHAHSDHTGFAERARTSGATVWVHGADAPVAQGGKPPRNDGKVTGYLLRAEFYRTLFSLGRRGGTRIVPIKEVSEFADGQTIDVPGSPRAVHAPGHTAGSCAILLEDRRVVITGDVMVTRNPMTGRQGPQIMPSSFNLDTQQALASIDAIAEMPADVILPGHGDPWTGTPVEAVRVARAAGPS